MLSPEDVLSITENVFGAMLGRDVKFTQPCELREEDGLITGSIQICGAWTGTVMLQTNEVFADLAARTMLAIEEQQVAPVDRQDTIAELTNMIGGNIKSLVPGPSILSLPSVTSGKEFDIRVFGTTIEDSIAFCCDGQHLRVVISFAVAIHELGE